MYIHTSTVVFDGKIRIQAIVQPTLSILNREKNATGFKDKLYLPTVGAKSKILFVIYCLPSNVIGGCE